MCIRCCTERTLVACGRGRSEQVRDLCAQTSKPPGGPKFNFACTDARAPASMYTSVLLCKLPEAELTSRRHSQWLKGPSQMQFLDVVEEVRDIKPMNAPSMNGGRRIRLKSTAEKIARRVRRHGKDESTTLQSPVKVQLLPSTLLSVDELVEELQGKEKNMLLDIIRTLRQSDLTCSDSPMASPCDSDDAAHKKKADMLVRLDMETLKRIAQKSQPAQGELPTSANGGNLDQRAKTVAKNAAAPATKTNTDANSQAATVSGLSASQSAGEDVKATTSAEGEGKGSGDGAAAERPVSQGSDKDVLGFKSNGDDDAGPDTQDGPYPGAGARAPVYTARSSELVQQGLASLRIALNPDPSTRSETPEALQSRLSGFSMFSPMPSPLRTSIPLPRARPGTGASGISLESEMQLPSSIIATMRYAPEGAARGLALCFTCLARSPALCRVGVGVTARMPAPCCCGSMSTTGPGCTDSAAYLWARSTKGATHQCPNPTGRPCRHSATCPCKGIL